MTDTLFISCVPGLEDVLGMELAALGYSFEKSRAGVYVPFRDMAQVYELNLELRTASRVLLPLHKFTCKNKEQLYKEALAIDWKPFFKNLPTFAIDAVVHHHKTLTNSLFAAQTVKDAICDQLKAAFGSRPSVDTQDPDVSIHLFILGEKAVISFDTSGAPLHVRGYRLEGGKAPLRETLAAALLYLSGFKGDEYVVDPCCGSATILIEAALMASKTAPGLFRTRFGHFAHPAFSDAEFKAVRSKVSKKKQVLEKGRFYGIEKSSKAAFFAQKTVRRVHLDGVVVVVEGDFRTTDVPIEPNFVITNPPYGVRLETTDTLMDLYQDLGKFLKQKTKKPSRGAILTGNSDLAKCIGLKTTKRHIVNNGGIECRLLEYDLY